MSRERAEFVRLAHDARVDAGRHLTRLSDGAGRAATSIARGHPWLVTSGAVALGALFVSSAGVGRRRRAVESAPAPLRSWSLGLGALALRWLPTVLRVGAAATPSAGTAGAATNAPSV